VRITDRLRADHKAFRKMLSDLTEMACRTPEDREAERLRRTVETLGRMVRYHAEVEDRIYFPAAERTGGFRLDILAGLVREHAAITMYLFKIEEQLATDAWTLTFSLLDRGLRGHLEREERDIFPVSERLMDEETLHQLGAKSIE
jgi:hemerythrin-like domain-containing protein